MNNSKDHALARVVRDSAYAISGATKDYDPLMGLIGDARFVLLGEASHGTHDFYDQRAQITKRVIEEKGFTAVEVEAAWPDAYRVNRSVPRTTDDAGSEGAVRGFTRLPTRRWRHV